MLRPVQQAGLDPMPRPWPVGGPGYRPRSARFIKKLIFLKINFFRNIWFGKKVDKKYYKIDKKVTKHMEYFLFKIKVLLHIKLRSHFKQVYYLLLI